MRIVAGSLKGRRLKAPSWEGLRPTSDKLRETLFNVLAPRIAGARVLDGFAGTGALGIEALSRGASHVTFIEQDRRAQALIAENLAHCGSRMAVLSSGHPLLEAPARSERTPRSCRSTSSCSTRRTTSSPMRFWRMRRALSHGRTVVLEHAKRQPAARRASGRLASFGRT